MRQQLHHEGGGKTTTAFLFVAIRRLLRGQRSEVCGLFSRTKSNQISRISLWRYTPHATHTTTARAQITVNWTPDIPPCIAAPTGDTQSQTDSDWIHYYARIGGWGSGQEDRHNQTFPNFKPRGEISACVFVWPCICMHVVRVHVDECVITSLWNQFPVGCAKDSSLRTVWFVKLQKECVHLSPAGNDVNNTLRNPDISKCVLLEGKILCVLQK